MKLVFHSDATTELDEAHKWYEGQQPGLGGRFVEEVRYTLRRIQTFPRLGNPLVRDIRRMIVPNFPYGIIYSASVESIEVYALAHLHRKPFYWEKRRNGG